MFDFRLASRRTILASIAALFGAAWGGSRKAAAQEKVSQVEAKYRNQPNGQQRCEICLQFEPPNTCKIVQGRINPKGWCQFFAAKENAH
jgi:hypothetical protein